MPVQLLCLTSAISWARRVRCFYDNETDGYNSLLQKDNTQVTVCQDGERRQLATYSGTLCVAISGHSLSFNLWAPLILNPYWSTTANHTQS